MSLKNRILLALGCCALIGGAGCAQDFEQPDFAHDEGQPWCDELAAGNGATDCALLFDEDHLLFFDYASTSRGTRLTVNLNTLEGQEVQSFGPITIEDAMASPALRDINGDDREELFIPLLTGNVNTLWSVWQQDDEGLFQRVGELSGFGVDAFDVRDGLVITRSRGDAATSYETASRLTVDGLGTVYELLIDHAAHDCRLLDQSGMAAMRLSATAVVAACKAQDW
ncbi:hypothetical protein [uncultured Maricaulis sp.]|uniref:hypothetical protein n=1 Tax=uncultured Maricaulis sp. TaxID=174710 RepID=UPI0030D7C0A0|tara:strand:+ start:5358 stop:6035 length:678 start_codon:yes stop_codon:yes gene_type:complete